MSDYNYYEYHSDNEYRDPYTQNSYGTGNGGNGDKKPKKEHKLVKTLGKTAAIALVFGLVGGVVFQGTVHITGHMLGDDVKTAQIQESKQADNAEESESVPVIGNSVTESESGSTAAATATTTGSDVSGIVQNVMPSIVQVTNMSVVEYRNWFGYGQYESESAGSGIIIGQDDDYLYIASNNHVVANSKSLTITFSDATAVPAEIQGTLPSSDLAVVKVKLSDIPAETMSVISVASLGSSDDLTVGEGAIVIGNALGYGQSVTTGIISALDREVTLRNDDGSTFTNYLIQTDAAVNPGNSGGALLNMKGEVVGIVSAKYSDTNVEGMGYAIPISRASEILTGLVTNSDTVTADNNVDNIGNTAYLGIAGVDVTEDLANTYSIPTGIYVAQTRAEGGAGDAGLVKGDIITGVDDTAVSSMEELSSIISAHKPGDVVRVTYRSAESKYNATVSVDVTLGTKPAQVQ
ncbi:MAG: trypsin-like peptidase domain-containing protein [Lachnospiraceae bacterium]|nr:trypsin-like peptidase domain-containing protein [Lachnospiraceae bacterium]